MISRQDDSVTMRVVRLTPPGRGAVASVLVDGPGAAELVQSLVHAKSGRPLGEYGLDRLILGNFNGENGEEIVVRPRSAQAVELHCHGGFTAAAMIEDTLRQKGCQVVAWQEWAAESHDDPIAAAALVALADATTQRTAGILLDQYHGALGRDFEAIQAHIDGNDMAAARELVESLSSYIPLGLHLVKPWQVVLAGPPNAGKSSLINAIVGFQRSIVHHTPGTTRDAVTVTTAMDGWPVELCDTAGLHSKAQGIEKAGIELSEQKIRDANLVVLVFDLSENWSATNQSLLESNPEAVVVYNKADILGTDNNILQERPEGILTSALMGTGIAELVTKISDRLVPNPPPPGAAVPFTLEQTDQVREFARRLG